MQFEINAVTDPRLQALVHTDERIEIPNRAPIRPIDQPFIDFASPCQIWRGGLSGEVIHAPGLAIEW
ncbi:hypothetical protein SAMN02787148_107208 [Burkholderia vietnamiensis]|nr:hypothetical protein EC918_10691 [Burkholderia vietnamiensis]SCZ29520.1 hypothetical protein SAMN02787148_107208 [Burkholderia vietnamiensis]SFX72029.1 hypothetical protein SAMN02787160_107209 [Burkholderia vietnamiensis]